MRNTREKSRVGTLRWGVQGHPSAMSLPLAPLIYPIVDGFVPQLRVLRLKDPMAFAGEVQHLGRNPQSLQRREELKSFAHIEPIIVLAVNHQRRRFEFIGEQVR